MTTMTKTTHIQFQIDGEQDTLKMMAVGQKIYDEIVAAVAAGKTDGVYDYVDGSRFNVKRYWLDQAAAEEHIANVQAFAQEGGITVISAVVIDGGRVV